MRKEKVAEIQVMAKKYNERLVSDKQHGKEIKDNGGMLLLGDCYGISNKIFFGFNRKGFDVYTKGEFIVEPIAENGPWEIDKATEESVKAKGNNPPSYWINCARCFSSDNLLYQWIQNATSAFLVPWRTKSVDGVLSHPLSREILGYSITIARRIIKHHSSGMLVVAGPTVCNLYIGVSASRLSLTS